MSKTASAATPAKWRFTAVSSCRARAVSRGTRRSTEVLLGGGTIATVLIADLPVDRAGREDG